MAFLAIYQNRRCLLTVESNAWNLGHKTTLYCSHHTMLYHHHARDFLANFKVYPVILASDVSPCHAHQ